MTFALNGTSYCLFNGWWTKRYIDFSAAGSDRFYLQILNVSKDKCLSKLECFAIHIYISIQFIRYWKLKKGRSFAKLQLAKDETLHQLIFIRKYKIVIEIEFSLSFSLPDPVKLPFLPFHSKCKVNFLKIHKEITRSLSNKSSKLLGIVALITSPYQMHQRDSLTLLTFL